MAAARDVSPTNLYQYASQQLLRANVENTKEPLVEAEELLGQIYEAWQEIGKAPH
jgi:flagellin-specific chaperone FliS